MMIQKPVLKCIDKVFDVLHIRLLIGALSRIKLGGT